MASFEATFNNFLWLGLFVFAGLSLIFIIQADNGAPQPLEEDPLINISFNELRANITAGENASETQYGIFNSEKPKPSLGSIVLFTIVSAGKTFGAIVINVFFILIKLPVLILSLDPTIISILITWLSISLITALWLLYKFGG